MSSGKTIRKKLKLPGCNRLSNQLVKAVEDNDIFQVKSLRESGVSLSSSDRNKNNLLHLAIQKQKEGSTIDVFEYLLTCKEIPIDDRNSDGLSPLLEAFGHKHDSEVYALKLIKTGCDTNEPFPDGNTVLHLAVYNKWSQVAELLIERGFDVDCQNSDGETPLHIACKMGSIDDIWMLLFYGADPHFTYMIEAEYTNRTTFTTVNFFDIVILTNSHPEIKDVFLKNLQFKYEKSFSLMLFIEAMETNSGLFFELFEISDHIHYTYDDLKAFSQRIATFSPNLFTLFVQDFPYVVEEMLHRCCLDELFICEESQYLSNYATNMFTLLNRDLIDIFIDEIRKN